MSKKSIFAVGLVLVLTLALILSPSSGALAQCGGSGSGYLSSMHNQHLGTSGQMGSGQMGMSGQAPVQANPNLAPGYVAPAPPVSGYTDPQNTGGYGSGQMMNQGARAPVTAATWELTDSKHLKQVGADAYLLPLGFK